jgi:glyoxylase-like metal-dependent hydrolase (beta-lactamase superfamily II)
MKIEPLCVGPFEVNCAVIRAAPDLALVIDPGFDAPEIRSILELHGLRVAAYLLTHGHADHLSALAALHATHPAPVYLHAEDFSWAFGPQNQIPPLYPVPSKPNAEFIHPEQLAAPLQFGEIALRCLETPGHTRGGLCYYFEQEALLFTGDTLFKGTCGRTDLPGGNARTLSASLKRLAALPDDTTVIPGHGERTSIGTEKHANFFMQQAARS